MTEKKEEKKVHPLMRAWVAGVFESRNPFPKNGYMIKIEALNNQPLIDRIYEVLGRGQVYQRTKRATPGILYCWQTNNMDEARDILLMVAPFVTKNRAKEVADLLARIERNPRWQKNHPEKATSSVLASPARTADRKTTQP